MAYRSLSTLLYKSMARAYVISLIRLVSLLSAILLTISIICYGQFTGAYLDASSTIFTSTANGDMCKAINNAYLSANLATGTFFTGTIDARGFTGVQPCTTDPFGGGTQNHYVYLLLNSNVQIVTGVGWFTPQKAHVIDGGAPGGPGNPSTGNVDFGAKIIGCGPTAPNWNGTFSQCQITIAGQQVNVQQITGHPNLIFNVHHGPFAAGSYTCILCVGGAQFVDSMGMTQYGWNIDSFGAIIRGVRVDLGGNSNIFGLYTQNQEETSEWSHVRCGGYSSDGSNHGGACAFVDRVEAPTGQSGPGNSVLDQLNIGADLSADGQNNYGVVSEGENITIEFTGLTCTTYPIAFVTGVNQASPFGIARIQLQYSGTGCTVTGSPVAQAFYPNSMGAFSGSPPVWSTGKNDGGAMFNVTLAGGGVSIFTLSTNGSNYPQSFVSGPRAITNLTVVGSLSGRLNGGLVFDGKATGNVNSVHCEKMFGGSGIGSGDCVQSGTFGFQAGGVFQNVTANSDVQGAGIHFGVGIDNNQVVTSSAALRSATSFTELLVDDLNLPSTPLSPTTCDNGGAGTGTPRSGMLATYIPGSLMRCGSNLGYYLPEVGSPPSSGLSGFDLFYGKSSIQWPAFRPNAGIEELLAGVSGSLTANDFAMFSSTTTGALVDSGISSASPVFGTSASSPLYTSPATPGTLTIQPGADTTQSILFKSHSSPTVMASLDTSTSGGQLAIGKTSAPSATLDVAGNLLVQSGGTISKYKSISTTRGGVPSIVGTDNESGKTAAVGPISLLSPTIAGLYRACFAAVVTQAGGGVTPSSTLGGIGAGFRITYTDGDTGGSVTTPAAGAPAGGSNTAYSQTNQNNTAGTQASGCVVINSAASGSISYSFGYSSSGSGGTLMQYSIHVSLEALY